MELPIQITFHGMDHSAALEAAIRARAVKLERILPQVIGCRAVIEETARHKHQGKGFVVCLDITVAGKEIAVNRDHGEDPFVAVRDAFDAARRQLGDHARRQRGKVKSQGPG